MKKITIGRGEGVDIFIDDEMISRQHAFLIIHASGKMELMDLGSKNGTYINGARMEPNKRVPVTRKNVITFAEVRKLDWSKIPDNTKYFKIGAIILAAIIALLILFGIGSFCYNKFIADKPSKTEYLQDDATQQGGTQQGCTQQGGQSGNVSSVNQNEKSEGQSGSGSSGKKEDAPERELSRREINRIFSPTPKENTNKKESEEKKEDKKEKGKKEGKKKEEGNKKKEEDSNKNESNKTDVIDL